MASFFQLTLMILVMSVYSEPWYSIPLKFTANNEHFVTTMSFGSPIAFDVDVIMDTGSGKFHIYNHKQNNMTRNNIIPYDTNSFKCICQTMIDNNNNNNNNNNIAYLVELNDTWYQYDKTTINNTKNHSIDIIENYQPFLFGCPLWNETYCTQWGAQCDWTDITIYDHEIYNDTMYNNNHTYKHETCKANNANYGLLVNGETVTFKCNNNCYSGIDIISFKDVNTNNNNNYVSYVYSDSITLNNKEHNISLFNNESWADGTLGLVYNSQKQTSFWQILGLNKQQHSALIAFDSLRYKIDIGDIANEYNQNDIQYSENIWWTTDYHYFYIYSLSICNIDLFHVLNIGAYYLAMIDTGATCLTLPPEMFDLLFKYIPYAFICNGNQTFCYISQNNMNSNQLNDIYKFPMLSFKLNVNKNNSKTFHISLKDLIIKLSQDNKGISYCIERGKNSISKIDGCTPDPQPNSKATDCTSNGIIIFGSKVLRSLYTVFDYPNKRIGFGNNKLANYSDEIYRKVNEQTCKVIQADCVGDDWLNLTHNICQSGADKCGEYWGWTYDIQTHYCVVQSWVYAVIPIVWITIIVMLTIFVKLKMWIDQHIYYTAIKV